MDSPPLSPFRPGPWALVAGAGAAVLVLALLPPFSPLPLRVALMEGFHLMCHQLPARSFAVDGVPVALCHRCTGVAAGLAVGAVLVALVGRRRGALVAFERPLLLAALAFAALDWLLGVSGAWANTPASRVLTGLAVGVVAGYLLARSVAAPERRVEDGAPLAPATTP